MNDLLYKLLFFSLLPASEVPPICVYKEDKPARQLDGLFRSERISCENSDFCGQIMLRKICKEVHLVLWVTCNLEKSLSKETSVQFF